MNEIPPTQAPDTTLHETARRYVELWSLRNPTHLATTAMGHVLHVIRQDGTAAILKCLSETGRREEGSAPSVLRAFAGSGAVKLLEAGDDAHLIEYCQGPQLYSWSDGQQDDIALPIIADIVTRLHASGAPRPKSVPSLVDRCMVLDRMLPRVDGQIQDRLLQARRIADELLATQSSTLLHGDLHHENILCTESSGDGRWLAIDPQGVWGDPAYEVANIFGNPLGHPEITLAKERPLHLAMMFARTLNFAPRRTLKWSYVHSCIAAAWAIEDGTDPSHRIAVADLVAAASTKAP